MAISSKMVFESLLASSTGEVGYFALYAGGIALLLVCLLTVQVILLRASLIIRQRRKRTAQEIWRKYFCYRLVGESHVTPAIRRRDVYFILDEYNYMFGLVKGNELEQLRSSFYELDMPVSFYALLHSRDMQKRLYALIALGNLQDKPAWGSIVQCLNQEPIVISLSAARALVLIDAEKAVNEIIPALLQRKDWPWANVAHILKLAGPKLVCRKLFDLIQEVESQRQASLLRLYDILRCEAEYPVSSKILANATDDKVASICLNISQDPNIVYAAREYIRHSRWHVRMNAAVALGRFGDRTDVPGLVELLKDSQWWVRYRAAQAIVDMPFIDENYIQTLRANLNDRYADDILVQVLNEGAYDK